MNRDIFISYSNKDSVIATDLCSYLENNELTCWIAPRNIRAGFLYGAEIVSAIKACRIFILIYSANSNNSEHVANEIDLAFGNKKIIIPFKIDEIPPCDSFEYYLNNKHWINASSDPRKFFTILYSQCRDIICGENDNAQPSILTKFTSDTDNLLNQANKEFDSDHFEKAMALFLKLFKTNQSDAHSIYRLGKCLYETGNYKEAVKYYQLAAEKGDPSAQAQLGYCYSNGQGVNYNKQVAIKWYHLAANQGDPIAQFNLGCCYQNGEGVFENKKEAVKWFRLAAEQGNPYAQYNLANCYYYGKGIAENKKEAVRWYRKAAELGAADAQYNLATCYFSGEGIAENFNEAIKWYRLAAEQGHFDAQNNLRILLS